MENKKKFLTCITTLLLVLLIPFVFVGCKEEPVTTNIPSQVVNVREDFIKDREIKSVDIFDKKTEVSTSSIILRNMCTYKIENVSVTVKIGSSSETINLGKINLDDYVFLGEDEKDFYTDYTIPEFAARIGITSGKYNGRDVEKIVYDLSLKETYPINVCFSDSLVHVLYYQTDTPRVVSVSDLAKNENNSCYAYKEMIRPLDWIKEIVYK